jgi:hypothetical protein
MRARARARAAARAAAHDGAPVVATAHSSWRPESPAPTAWVLKFALLLLVM